MAINTKGMAGWLQYAYVRIACMSVHHKRPYVGDDCSLKIYGFLIVLGIGCSQYPCGRNLWRSNINSLHRSLILDLSCGDVYHLRDSHSYCLCRIFTRNALIGGDFAVGFCDAICDWKFSSDYARGRKHYSILFLNRTQLLSSLASLAKCYRDGF